MISVIIPTYQHGKIIKRCLNSIFNQTYKNYEVIVVNDGSTDNTAKVLKNYSRRIKIIFQENKGANIARNNGFKHAQGEFIIFCDADVVAKKTMLEKMLKALEENPSCAYAYSAFKWGWKTFKLWSFDSEKLKKVNYITTTSLIKRKCFPGFDVTIKRFQDWDLWLTMLEKGDKGIYIPEVLFKIKPRKKGMSNWLPSFIYQLPWRKFGIRLKNLEKYHEAEKIIKTKHHLL